MTGTRDKTHLWLGVFLLLAGLSVAIPTEVRAQAESTDVSGGVDLKFGPYQPAIDAELGPDQKPFADVFGDYPRVLGQLTAEYYVWQGHGSLGVGLTAGYTSFGGESEIQGDSNGSSDGGGGGDNTNNNGSEGTSDTLSLEENTSFEVLPLGLVVGYRWDYLIERYGIPFAARVEGGFDYYLWRVTDGSGNVAKTAGEEARGGTPGIHGAGRLEFHLNWLDEQSAASMDVSWGINNTYFFGEFVASRVRDPGGTGFNLSDSSWRLGLAFEF